MGVPAAQGSRALQLSPSRLGGAADASGACCRVCGLNGQVATTPEGRAWNPAAPKTGDTANAALLAAIYGQLSSPFISAAQADRYICFARGQMRYVLGDKGQSLMVGFGGKAPTHAQVGPSVQLERWCRDARRSTLAVCSVSLVLSTGSAAAAARAKPLQVAPNLRARPTLGLVLQHEAASCSSTSNCTAASALFTNGANPHTVTGAVVEFATFSDSYKVLAPFPAI